MKIFISWHGERSRKTAEILKSWLSKVIQATEIWISTETEKGSRWAEKIVNELDQTKVGILCIDKSNLNSEWMLFEAGAISKTRDGFVCTFLVDISPSDIKPPLGLFQHTQYTKEDIKKLVFTINELVKKNSEKSLNEKDLTETFEQWWPILETDLKKIHTISENDNKKSRSDRELLEEILQTVREIQNIGQYPKYLSIPNSSNSDLSFIQESNYFPSAYQKLQSLLDYKSENKKQF